jgi:argininosuccinate lyase
MSKVWQKQSASGLNPIIEKYTAGSDPFWDGKLLKYELAASAAHSEMLFKIGILNKEELSSIRKEISSLYKQYGDEITLSVEDEDIHSKVENLLTASIGETGKKLHTGRSRNDQALTVIRLFEKESLFKAALEYCAFLENLIRLAQNEGEKILPGYTHTKQAMLINVKFWLSAFIEAGLDNLSFLKSVLSLIDANPLGSASGFGAPLALDRKMTAEALGFASVMKNAMHVQNSRGKQEGLVIDVLWCMMADFSRLASDLLLFNMDELLFVKTSDAITTGSSIMPQKRNLDVMELVRAKTSTMLSYSCTVKNISSGIVSGYNRDLQETKEPVFKAFELISDTIKAVTVVIQNVEFDEAAVKQRLSKGIFATDIAFESTQKGVPFREAYKIAAQKIESIEVNEKTIRESLDKRISEGSPKTINIKEYEVELSKEKRIFEENLKVMNEKLKELL